MLQVFRIWSCSTFYICMSLACTTVILIIFFSSSSKILYSNRYKTMNTWFKQHKHCLYAWTSPNKMHRNQIDCVLCSQQLTSTVLNVKTYSDADSTSDHELIRVKLWKIKRQHYKKCLTSPKSFPYMQFKWKIGLGTQPSHPHPERGNTVLNGLCFGHLQECYICYICYF